MKRTGLLLENIDATQMRWSEATKKRVRAGRMLLSGKSAPKRHWRWAWRGSPCKHGGSYSMIAAMMPTRRLGDSANSFVH